MPSFAAFSHRPTARPFGTVAIVTRDHLAAETVDSLMASWYTNASGADLAFTIVRGNVLPAQRNRALQRMIGDWVLFIDDDMVFDETAIPRLVESWSQLSHEHGDPVIVGGLCYGRHAADGYFPTLLRERREGVVSAQDSTIRMAYDFIETWDEPIVEVDATGGAFVLIPTTALEAVTGKPWPSLESRLASPAPEVYRWVHGLGEDLIFCQRAKDAGCRIFVDTRIEIGHVAKVVVHHGNVEHLRRSAGIVPAEQG